MKLLFNQASLYPTIEDKENLTTALDIVDTLVATNKVPTYSESNECITYFINKFLVPESEFYSPENFQVLHTRLRDLISDVELWIQQNSEKLRKKDEAIANELQAMPSESQKLLEKIRAFISSGRDSLSPDEHEYFRKIDRIFKRANDTWLFPFHRRHRRNVHLRSVRLPRHGSCSCLPFYTRQYTSRSLLWWCAE